MQEMTVKHILQEANTAITLRCIHLILHKHQTSLYDEPVIHNRETFVDVYYQFTTAKTSFKCHLYNLFDYMNIGIRDAKPPAYAKHSLSRVIVD